MTPPRRHPGLAAAVVLGLQGLLLTFAYGSWLYAPSAPHFIGTWVARLAALAALFATAVLVGTLLQALRHILRLRTASTRAQQKV